MTEPTPSDDTSGARSLGIFALGGAVGGLGGPETATLTCLATVLVATAAGVGAGLALDWLGALWGVATERRTSCGQEAASLEGAQPPREVAPDLGTTRPA